MLSWLWLVVSQSPNESISNIAILESLTSSVKITWDYRTVGIPSKILNPSNPQDFINTPGNYTLGIILEIILVKLFLNTFFLRDFRKTPFLLLLNSLLALATPHRWIAFIHLDCRAVMWYSTERWLMSAGSPAAPFRTMPLGGLIWMDCQGLIAHWCLDALAFDLSKLWLAFLCECVGVVRRGD